MSAVTVTKARVVIVDGRYAAVLPRDVTNRATERVRLFEHDVPHDLLGRDALVELTPRGARLHQHKFGDGKVIDVEYFVVSEGVVERLHLLECCYCGACVLSTREEVIERPPIAEELYKLLSTIFSRESVCRVVKTLTARGIDVHEEIGKLVMWMQMAVQRYLSTSSKIRVVEYANRRAMWSRVQLIIETFYYYYSMCKVRP